MHTPTTAPIVLHVEASWSSPWVAAAFVALREKAIPFTTSLSMLRRGVGLVEAMRERTLTGTAPVLQHGDFWLSESFAILEYLEETFPQHPVFPAHPHDRARARQLMIWIRYAHVALHEERPTERILYRAAAPPAAMSPAAQRAADALVTVATRLGLDGRGAAFGDRFGALDLDFAFSLQRLIAAGDPVPAPLRDYAAAVWARPSVREFVDHPRPPNPPS